MDAIQAARALGKAIQEDQRYLTMQLAQQKNDEDSGLQEQIKAFQQCREELNQTIHGPENNQEAIQALDSKLKGMYAEIFQNENMIAYNNAREEMNGLLAFINQIVIGSAEGHDPDSIEYQESCEGNCGSCGGCS